MNQCSSFMKHKLSSEELRICIQITENLAKHPIFTYFLRPVDPIADNASDYYLKIKNPQDLGTILKRLKDLNYYDYVDDWENDMNLIWKNCIQYNRENSYLANFAFEFKKKFEKMVEVLKIKKYEGWIYKVQELFEKIDRTMKIAPSSVKIDSSNMVFSQPITKQAISTFVRAACRLNSKEDTLHYIQLAMLNGAEYNQKKDEGVINLKTMKKSGIRQMIKYTKERYAAISMTYPE